jgi:hypothetical protein
MSNTTFLEHIANLDPWEAKMLNKTDNQHHKQLAQAILTKEQIYIVSYEGKSNGYGSFGWIIEGQQEYARGTGRRSRRSKRNYAIIQSRKAYRMLAAIRFLQQTCAWNDTWPATNKTIKVYSNKHEPYPTNFMAPQAYCRNSEERVSIGLRH